MLSPCQEERVRQLIAHFEEGIFTEKELGLQLALLATQDDISGSDILENTPPSAIEFVNEGLRFAAQMEEDDEYLWPEASPFAEGSIDSYYYSRVTQVLLESSNERPRPTATVVCLPSFEPEWAIRIRGSAIIGYSDELTEAK